MKKKSARCNVTSTNETVEAQRKEIIEIIQGIKDAWILNVIHGFIIGMTAKED